MEKLFYDISEVLGVTILHSLWQGLIIYCLVKLVLTLFPSVSSAIKCRVLFVSLAALTLWFVGTFFNEARNYQWSNTVASIHTPIIHQSVLESAPSIHSQPTESTFRESATHLVKTYLPYLSAIYIIVLLVNIGRFAVSWKKVGDVKRDISPDDTWQEKVNRFAEQLAIAKYVQLGLSKVVDGPCTVGYLKPVILMPLAFTAQLSTQEVEAILLHELAHIKNNDYLYNIIQQMMVVVLFLNPFALLISRMISSERENRCDDMVVAMTENPMPYARALVKLEEIRYNNMQLTLSAIGQKHHLLDRVERIIKRKEPIVNVRHLLAILLLFIFSVSSLAWLNPELKEGKLVSVRGARAVHNLVTLVKTIVSKGDERVANAKPAINDKTDTIRKGVGQPNTIIDLNQKDTLLAEYYLLLKELNKDREIAENSSEEQQMLAAKQRLDSVYSTKSSELFTISEVTRQQKAERNQALMENRKKYQPEINELSAKMQDVVDKHPDMMAYENAYRRGSDSILKKIHQATGLDQPAIFKTIEWKNWKDDQNARRGAIKLKIMSHPQIAARYDSLKLRLQNVFNNPEYEAIQKKYQYKPTHPTTESLAAQRMLDESLKEYRAAYDQAWDKYENSAGKKRYDADEVKIKVLYAKIKGR